MFKNHININCYISHNKDKHHNPNLQIIQKLIDQLSFLIQEVEAMPTSAEEESLKNKLLIWKSETDAVLEQEYPNYIPEIDDFNRSWRRPIAGSGFKTAIRKKLCNSRTDLRLIIKAEQPARWASQSQLLDYVIIEYAKALNL